MTRPFAFLKLLPNQLHTFASRTSHYTIQSLQKCAKVLHLTSVLLLLNFGVQSQNLNLNELFNICKKKNWNEVNELLVKKGWEYYESSKGDDEHYSTITWSYEKQGYNDKALGWFYLYTYEELPNKISYTLFNKQSYNSIKAAINTNGMKLVDSSIDDNKIKTKYANANFIISITTAKRIQDDESYGDSNSQTIYTIDVVNKSGVYDKDNGLKKIFDNDGNIESEFTLKDGNINGVAKGFYPNGQVKVISSFINGKKQGVSKEYDEDGNQTAEYNYVNGEATGAYKIYESSRIKLSGSLLFGKKNGLFRVYGSEGLLDMEYQAKNDLRDGKYTEYYYDEGKLYLKVTGQYSEGQKIGLWQTYKVNQKETELLEFENYTLGDKDGLFKEVRKDSVIFGTYKKGALHGDYSVYKNMTAWLMGGLHGDTTNAPLIAHGKYFEGLKYGEWKFYSMSKRLIKVGRFDDGLETGEWKYYLDNIIDEKGNSMPASGKLFLTENYDKGQKNGKSVRNWYLEKVAVKCDTTKNKNANPIDTCYSWSYKKILEIVYYKKDQLYGPFEYQDSAGSIKTKGNFVNNEKDGLWIETYEDEGVNNEPFTVYVKGNYAFGKRTGLWVKYFEGDIIFASYSYRDDKLHGKSTQYLKDDKPREEQFYENGYLKKVNVYDSLGSSISNTYEILLETETGIKCKRTENNEEGKITQIFSLKKDNPEPLNQDYFEFYFLIKTGKFSDGTSGFPDGELKVYDKNNKLKIEGALYKESRTGLWKYYYYDIDIYTEQEFVNNNGGIEKYYTLGASQLFSGKFVRKHPNGKVKNEFKIADGLRNGSSKYFDENGKLEKTIKYENGLTKE